MNAVEEAHIWVASLCTSAEVIEHYESILSATELDRANRFRFPHLRTSYVVSHGVLRLLLSHYAERSLASLEFEYGARGKPSLPGSRVMFNLSHSGDFAAVAFGWGRNVGIDVERVRPLDDVCGLARRCFARDEAKALEALPVAEQPATFFRLWTLKEAFLKATGEGLSRALDSFSIGLGPSPSLAIPGRPEEERNWSLHSFSPDDGYCAGFACEGLLPSLSFHTYSHENFTQDPLDARDCGAAISR